ncbi:glycoside hydrolase family 25 protein [Aurantibacter sp.]|uniref:glycoside hydrolase family 25 protein n=1 Tax=Aurantibacter sp. TaxID=2807103 RepID=UPI0035C85C9D
MKPKTAYTNYNKFLIALVVILAGYIVADISNRYYVTHYKNGNIENLKLSNSKYAFGIDVSHYNGVLDWDEINNSKHPIKFMFFRATMGKDGADKHFKRNWENAKKHHFIRGAYHYYRPSESSSLQFENFASKVALNKGDFTPVLDIEEQSPYGEANLRVGILNWLKLAEAKYGKKPIIYSGLSYYNNYLKGYVKDYPLWIASYSKNSKLKAIDWKFHQFSEKMVVNGIESHVDGNYFNGSIEEMLLLCE